MATLRSMFPSESKERFEEALRATDNVEDAIDYVISSVNKGDKRLKCRTFLCFVGTFKKNSMIIKLKN